MDYQSRVKEVQRQYQEEMRKIQDQMNKERNNLMQQRRLPVNGLQNNQDAADPNAPVPVQMQILGVLGEIKSLLVDLTKSNQAEDKAAVSAPQVEEVKEVQPNKKNK